MLEKTPKEKYYQGKYVNPYFAAKPETCLYDTKVAKRGVFRFAQLEDQQVRYLLNAKHRSMHYKIPDDTISFKPGDGFCLVKSGAWVIVFYIKERKFLFLDIDVVMAHKEKPLRYEEALLLASRVVSY